MCNKQTLVPFIPFLLAFFVSLYITFLLVYTYYFYFSLKIVSNMGKVVEIFRYDQWGLNNQNAPRKKVLHLHKILICYLKCQISQVQRFYITYISKLHRKNIIHIKLIPVFEFLREWMFLFLAFLFRNLLHALLRCFRTLSVYAIFLKYLYTKSETVDF